MAVLWEQRELLCELEKLQLEELEDHGRYLRSKASTKDAHVVFRGDGVFWIEENKLIDRILKKREKNLLDFGEILHIRKVIDASINPDAFFLERENKEYDKDKTKVPTLENTSKRELTINPDKGSELLNSWYFCFKYMASVFPPLTTVLVTILTTILTSGAVWLFLLHFLRQS